MNTLDTMLVLDKSQASEQAAFKLRFITFYHVVAGLRGLRNSHEPELATAIGPCLRTSIGTRRQLCSSAPHQGSCSAPLCTTA